MGLGVGMLRELRQAPRRQVLILLELLFQGGVGRFRGGVDMGMEYVHLDYIT